MAFQSSARALVNLHLSCDSILRLDITSASDPFVVVHLKRGNSKYKEVGRTETKKNDSNPVFEKSIQVYYLFEESQQLKFSVYDRDEKSDDLNLQDFVGLCETTLAALVKNGSMKMPLYNPDLVRLPGMKRGAGDLNITVSVEPERKTIVTLKLRGKKLDRKDGFGLGKSDPYYTICTRNSATEQRLIHHKSEIIMKSLDPVWREQQFLVHDPQKKVLVIVEDYDKNSTPDLIGEAEVCLASIEPGQVVNLINPHKKRKNKVAGQIIFERCTYEPYPTFVEYLNSGCRIQFVVALDFTASNKHPADPQSLHSLASPEPNDYMRALYAVGGIIAEYSSDNLFPAFGFGAVLPGQRVPNFAFPLNGTANPNCVGINGVIDAYRVALHNVKLAGPTNFSPIIQETIRLSRVLAKTMTYTALLIITDGAITDLDSTMERLVDASECAMGVIIIGVGPASFKAMERLDSDDRLLCSPSGRRAKRDVVQFVAFRDFQRRTMEDLAAEVLRELPSDLVHYFMSHGIRPPKKESE